jgi:hypothetical protein
MFILLNLESAEIVSRAQFVDGKKAARAARLLSSKTGRKYQPRKAPDCVAWEARERARFASGEYIGLHHELEAIAPDSHFAHVAKKSHDLIAYTKDAVKGAQDKQSLLSVAAYIELVAPSDWTAGDKAVVARRHIDYAASLASPLKFAGPGTDKATADLIEEVYTKYASNCSAVAASCMRHDASRFSGRVDGKRVHPVRAYAGGDLAIAYLTNSEGETTARALVWPAKKLYSRLYCGEDSTLPRLLKSLGYDGAGYYNNDPSMEGAKLARIESDSGTLIVPYLDEVGTVEDCGSYLRIGGDLDATSTNGVIEIEPSGYCESCENSCDEDDLSTVWLDSRRRRSGMWCEHCRDNYTFYCDGTYETYSQNVDHTCIDVEVYCDAYLEDNASICDYSGEWTFGELKTVIIDESGNEEQWSEYYVESCAYEFDGAIYSCGVDSVKITTTRGAWRVYEWFALAWQYDKTIKAPRHIVEESIENDLVPLAYLATDGRYYSPGCVNLRQSPMPEPVAETEIAIAA